MSPSQQVPKVEYERILYTTDLSESGRHAFPYAASIANRYGAQLTVFHVFETAGFEKQVVGYISEDLWDEIKTQNLEEARSILVNRKRNDVAIENAVDQFCHDALGPGAEPYLTYEVVVKAGDPVEQIIEEAHSGNYDLVVIGRRGRRVIKDALMGSTAWEVLHRCRVPVMVVRLPEDD